MNGDIEVFDGALLSSSSTINGMLQIVDSAPGVVNSICSSTVTGKVFVFGTNAGTATYFGQLDSQCAGDVIAASVLFDRNAGTVELVDATVNGQVTFHANTGMAVVGGNTINGVMHCALNTDISNGGLPNTANNDVNSLQCAGL